MRGRRPTRLAPGRDCCRWPAGCCSPRCLLVGAQWVVVLHPDSPWLLLAVLGLPDLFAAYALTRALTVTTVDAPRRRGGRR